MTEEEAAERMEADDAGAEADVEDEGTDLLGLESTRLVAEVATQDAELATDLEDHLADLEADRDAAEERVEDLESTLQRTQADFQNYKKRAKRQQEDIRERATEDLVERLLDVRDNLGRALEQEGEADSIREGVEATLRAFDDVLDDEGVEAIEPSPGDDVDPHRHEVMMRVESDQPEDAVAEVYRPGYEMGDAVLRTAQVAVSDGE